MGVWEGVTPAICGPHLLKFLAKFSNEKRRKSIYTSKGLNYIKKLYFIQNKKKLLKTFSK
jgi:hypothetical protein